MKYKYPLFGFIYVFILSLISITVEDIIHNVPLMNALISWHHYISPIVLGIIGSMLGYLIKKIQLKQEQTYISLLNSETKFRKYIDHAADAIYVHNEKGEIIDFNIEALKELGYERFELKNKFIFKIIDKAISPASYKSKLNALGEDNLIILEHQHVRKNGSKFPVEVKICKLDIDNEVQYISLARNITARKRAEIELDESKERFKRLSDLTYEGILIHDKGIVKEMNKSLQRMLGYSYKELYGKNAMDIIVHTNYINTVYKFLSWDQAPPYEILGVRKDGSTLPIEIESHNMDYDGETLRVTAFRNISKQKEAQRNLKRFHTAVEQSANTIIITDSEGHIQYTNSRFSKQTGYLQEEVLGKTPNILKSDKHNSHFYKTLWETIKKGEVWSDEICNKKKNGELYWENMTITPVLNDSKEIINFIAVKEDITDKKQADRNLLSAIIDTEEKERKRFAENLHDELGPFLSGINLYINELGYEDVDYQKRLSLIDYLKYFVNEAVEKTRSISHQLMPNILFDYGLVIALESFSNKINKAKNISIKLKTNTKERLGNKTIEVVIYRMAIELINNTIKHAKASEINMNITVSNNTFEFSYSDNGIGFNLDEKLNLNSGLGLQNTFNRLKSIEGSYEFTSNNNKGIFYKFIVPL